MTRSRLASVFGLTLMVAAGLLASASPAAAGAITVTRFDDPAPAGACDPGDCSLREGIMAANAAPGPNTIMLAAGTYSLTIEGSVDNVGSTGDLDITDDLSITGAGPERTVIDGAWATDPDRVLDIPTANDEVTISAVTVQDGNTVAISESGGGIRVLGGSSLTLEDAIIRSNEADDAGGLNIDEPASSATLRRVTVTENRGVFCCGGIGHYDSAGTLTLVDSTVVRNVSDDSDGGIYTDGTTNLDRVTISENTADSVVGGFSVSGPTTMTNVTISGNRSTDDGGGIFINDSLSLNNVTITRNVADSDGAGGGEGGGLFEFAESSVTIRNSIVAGNSDGSGETPDCSGDFDSAGHNLIGSTAGCTFNAGTGDLLNVDPKLAPLTDNGGLTLTHALLKGSPAINAAGTDAAPSDQRGLQRKDPDIGAYERVLCAKVAVNRIGTNGKDKLRGTGGADGILGMGGKDTLIGKGGKDGLCGGGGKDKLKGGGGKDRLKGQGGKDTCVGGGGKDRATCERERTV